MRRPSSLGAAITPRSSVDWLVDRARQSPSTSLQAPLRSEMEERLGVDLKSVRVHTDSTAAAAAQALSAEAYTVGKDVFFAQGRFDISSDPGRGLIAHELVHTAQQRGEGTSGPLEIGRPDSHLEKEAHDLSSHLATKSPTGDQGIRPSRTAPVLQRQMYPPVPLMVHPTPAGSPVEVSAVDDRQAKSIPWYKPARYTGPLASLLRGDVTMTNVSTMADNVLKFAGTRSIKRLNVMDHGNAQASKIGDDWLWGPDQVTAHSGDFGKLKGHFTGDGFVHMQNCEAGQNKALICALSSAMGSPVFAGTGYHNPLYNFNTGDYVSCSSSGAWNPDAGRPSTPAVPQPDDTKTA